MEERIVQFVSALRAAGARISLAESADAFRAIDQLGIKDREAFRLSLQTTLIKDSEQLPVFAELFPVFFGSADSPAVLNPSQDLTPQEAQMIAQALQQFKEQLQSMLDRLIRGELLSQEDLAKLARMVGLTQAEDMRYRKWMLQRMKKALRFREVQQAIEELAQMLAQMGMDKNRVSQLSQMMQANQQAIEQQLNQFAGKRIAENMGNRPRSQGIDGLLNRPFNTLSDRDMEKLRAEVKRLASMIKTRVALRQKRARSGQLDAKATIRANLKHGSVPIQIKHRERTLKPRLVVICDISTSMRFCSELMLSLLFELQDQISKTFAYAFIDHLEFISQDFVGKSPQQAVNQVLTRMPAGYYNTDLGNSLSNFQHSYMDRVDSRTTLIIVGDGRNNYNNPRLDIFDRLAGRSRRTIWLNPEAPALWGTGDSDMLQYAAGCDDILRASTLAQLTLAINHLLVP